MGTLGSRDSVGTLGSRDSGDSGEWGRQFQICVDVVPGGGGDTIGVMKLRALGVLQREAIRRRRSPSPFILRLYTNALRRVGVKLP